ncbi:shikimate dehydrogenase [Moraxella cuniculi]|uniref:Shikimate dehydrogenase (NADP(+)) n=1 Tax=Moraxella cuniculi TaxID=34061 RepID=A0A3S4QRT9_9GAMM|nr:shikimate dehydrogenase [Moraxella cuniculi]VEG12847.1 Shikimate dehydrogenase [Moraxella cuniculi]
MQHFIVIGNPINHSKSPEIHHAFAASVGLPICYQRQLCPDNFDSFVAVVSAFFAGGGKGANVTLPFKQMAHQLVQSQGEISDDARHAGAVNTLMIKNGKLYGDNTDGRGLVADLQAHGITLANKKVAIIGAGGATRGAILPLLSTGCSLDIYNRTIDKAWQLLEQFNHPALSARPLSDLTTARYDLIINATSATTTGQTLTLGNCQASAAYDMMYGKPSEFLAHFQHQGAATFDGFGMLIQQAKLSFELWTGKMLDLDKITLP